MRPNPTLYPITHLPGGEKKVGGNKSDQFAAAFAKNPEVVCPNYALKWVTVSFAFTFAPKQISFSCAVVPKLRRHVTAQTMRAAFWVS